MNAQDLFKELSKIAPDLRRTTPIFTDDGDPMTGVEVVRDPWGMAGDAIILETD